MKITSPKDTTFKLKLSHKELKVIERALNFADNYDLDDINDNLFDSDEFNTEEEYEKFESKIWKKIVDKLSHIDVY